MNDTFALFFVTWAFISVTLFFVYVTLMKRCNAGMLYMYLQLIISQYFISNKSGIWSLSLIVHSKG